MGCRASNVTGQILMVPGTILRSVSHTIGFQHEPFARAIRVSNVTMQVMQKAAPPGPARAVMSNLNWVDYVFPFHAIADREVPENTIGFTDSVIPVLEAAGGTSTHWRNINQSIGFTQTLGVIGPIVLFIHQGIPFSQTVHNCVSNLGPHEITQEINFKHWVSDTPSESLSHTIGFTHSVDRVHPVHHVIGFYDNVNGGVGLDVSQEIGFTHTVDPGDSLWNISVTSPIAFSQAMTYYFEGGCEEKQYNKFEGTGDAVGVADAPLTFDAQFALESIEGTKETLYLRSPETDDKHRIGYSRVNRETRGGEINIYQDPAWPQVHTLLFTVTALSDGTGSCPDKIGLLMDFFQDHLGQEVFLHDWEGITWRGVITTPNEVATEDRDKWWTIAFEFIGEALDGSEADQNLNFSQSVLINGDWVRSASNTIGFTQEVDLSILGDHPQSVSQTIGFTQSVSAILEHPVLEDDFSGAGAALHGTSPDVGSGTWMAHTSYLDNGTMSAGVNSGAYYAWVPTSGKTYEIIWETSAITESDRLESRCFIAVNTPSYAEQLGGTMNGNAWSTTLRAGFILRDFGGTQSNACRMGDDYDGEADTVVFTDATLRTEDDAIDLRLVLDTTGGAGNWTATWYAKDPAASAWTLVRDEETLLSEAIGAVGWSNDNNTTTFTMDEIKVIERTDV